MLGRNEASHEPRNQIAKCILPIKEGPEARSPKLKRSQVSLPIESQIGEINRCKSPRTFGWQFGRVIGLRGEGKTPFFTRNTALGNCDKWNLHTDVFERKFAPGHPSIHGAQHTLRTAWGWGCCSGATIVKTFLRFSSSERSEAGKSEEISPDRITRETREQSLSSAWEIASMQRTTHEVN